MRRAEFDRPLSARSRRLKEDVPISPVSGIEHPGYVAAEHIKAPQPLQGLGFVPHALGCWSREGQLM